MAVVKTIRSFTISKYIAKSFVKRKKCIILKTIKKKKLIFGLLATVLLGNLSYGQRHINRPKAGFMAVGDVIAGAACVSLGPYGVLWGGFMGSCAAATLWNDMQHSRMSVPIVKNNPDGFFDEFALVGKLHNELMIKYCNENDANNVFTKEGKPSEYIKNQMLESKYFDQSTEEKEKFIENLSIFDNLFNQMENKEDISTIVHELNKINNANFEEQSYYTRIIDFTLQEEPRKPEEIFSFVNELEDSVKGSSKLKEESKNKLFYSLEILRYSYALWYENIQE